MPIHGNESILCNFMSLQIFCKRILLSNIHQVPSIQKHIPSMLAVHRKSSSESISSQVCQRPGSWWGSGHPGPHHLLRVLLLPLQEEGGWEEGQRARRSDREQRYWRKDLIWNLCFDKKFLWILKIFEYGMDPFAEENANRSRQYEPLFGYIIKLSAGKCLWQRCGHGGWRRKSLWGLYNSKDLWWIGELVLVQQVRWSSRAFDLLF